MNAMTELDNLKALHPAENFIMLRDVKITVNEIIPFKKGGHHPLALLDNIVESLIAKNDANEDAIYGIITRLVAGSFDPDSKLHGHVIGSLLHCSNITQEQIETCNMAHITDLALKIVEVNIGFFTEAVSKITASLTTLKN